VAEGPEDRQLGVEIVALNEGSEENASAAQQSSKSTRYWSIRTVLSWNAHDMKGRILISSYASSLFFVLSMTIYSTARASILDII
jgi:hypothetical protein